MKGQILFQVNSWNQIHGTKPEHTETQTEAVLLKNYVCVLFLLKGHIIEVLVFSLTLLIVHFNTMNKVFYRGAGK